MNPIRQALHKAAMHYAKQAHHHYLMWIDAHEKAFSHALKGNQIERRLCNNKLAGHYAQYTQLITRAHRVREMMK